jgi:hypothetical protein
MADGAPSATRSTPALIISKRMPSKRKRPAALAIQR